MNRASGLRYLRDLWDENLAATLDEPELLRYRSNLLGADLRITNFGGGNTSSKVTQTDPLTGKLVEVLWVKGSGGDLGSIVRRGFATLYMDKLMALESRYEGVAKEDAMVDYYPLCTFGLNPTAASIDTPLHSFLPFRHVDHLHPDWAIAVAAAANGREKMEEFNREFGHKLVWLPWQRPGFQLGLMLRRAVQENPGCDGIVLGCHGLFTWGETQRECCRNSLTMIDHLGQFVLRHVEAKSADLFGGAILQPRGDRRDLAMRLLPFLRGRVSGNKRAIASWSDAPTVLGFVNSKNAAALAHMGTSCPDHFIRTKIRPMMVPATADDDLAALQQKIDLSLETYRAEYAAYYRQFAEPDSPPLRDTSPAVVLVPGIGMFSFGRSRQESRVVGEFYTNAIHVMEGATALADGRAVAGVPQAGASSPPEAFHAHTNYVALPPREAFRIEYWALEEAKLRRQPAEKELSRRIALIVGGASAIGRAVALLAAERGAHVVLADRDWAGAEAVAEEVRRIVGREAAAAVAIDPAGLNAVARAMRAAVAAFGGLDILILAGHDAAENPLPISEARDLFAEQGLDASVVLAGAAHSAAPRSNRDRMVRELTAQLGKSVRVNAVSVMAAGGGSAPAECAQAILFLAGPQAQGISGHVLPVGGGAQ